MTNNSSNTALWQCPFCMQINLAKAAVDNTCGNCGLEQKVEEPEAPTQSEPESEEIDESSGETKKVDRVELPEDELSETKEVTLNDSEPEKIEPENDLEKLIGMYDTNDDDADSDHEKKSIKQRHFLLRPVSLVAIVSLVLVVGGITTVTLLKEKPAASQEIVEVDKKPEPELEVEPESELEVPVVDLPVEVDKPEPVIKWELPVATGSEILPGHKTFLIQNEDYEIFSASTGEVLATIPSGKKDVRLVATKNNAWFMTPKKLWSWNTKSNNVTATNIKKGEQVRILGEEAFIFSKDKQKICVVKKGKKIDLEIPVKGAVPIFGSGNSQTVWATPKKKVVNISSKGKKKTVTPKAPAKGAEIIRWIGADKKHVYLLWAKNKTQFLTINSLKNGGVVANKKVTNAKETPWRISVNAGTALFGDLLINKSDGEIKKLDGNSSLDTAISDGFLVFDGPTQKLITFNEVITIPEHQIVVDRTVEGWLVLDESNDSLLHIRDLEVVTAQAN